MNPAVTIPIKIQDDCTDGLTFKTWKDCKSAHLRRLVQNAQGFGISPLLANIYLHVMDMYWMQTYSHLGKLIRYADDFVVVCR